MLPVALAAAVPVGGDVFFPAALADEPVSANSGLPVEADPWQGLPPGPGREIVFGLCQACHSLAIVKQQGLDRDSWDETLVWMVEEQGMPALNAEAWKLILDYLTTHYGADPG